MDKQAALERDYQTKKLDYEEQEETCMNQREKAMSIIEEVEERSCHYLNRAMVDIDIMMKGYRRSEHMKEEVMEVIHAREKEIARKLEQLDEDYISELKKLQD